MTGDGGKVADTMKKKQCSACLSLMFISDFHKDASTKDGLRRRCRECDKLRRPSNFKRASCVLCGMPASICSGMCVTCKNEVYRVEHFDSKRIWSQKYEKTIPGFLMRTYRNMESRVTGVQVLKAHLYLGKSLLPRESFYKWAKNSKEFHTLYLAWVEANYDRTLTPSIDRIDSDKGYTLDNMRWLTHSENSRNGNISRFYGKRAV